MVSVPENVSEAMHADPMQPNPFQVERVHKETDDTYTLTLKPQEETQLSQFAPGQFNMLYVFGVGEIAISISGDPASRNRVTHTTRVVGTVSKAMSRLRKGDMLGVRGPFGSAWPVNEVAGRDVVIVAGGIGLAPLRPALLHFLAHRRQIGRLILLYGARTAEDMLYPTELQKWSKKGELILHQTVDRATNAWKGNVGVVTKLIPHAPFDPSQTIAFVCGPEVMMRFTILELQRRGITAERLYLSMERNMKCAIGFCGHCQFGPDFVCKDGPVFRYDRVWRWMNLWEA